MFSTFPHLTGRGLITAHLEVPQSLPKIRDEQRGILFPHSATA